MRLRTVTVNYIPDCFKTGIFFKMILEVHVNLITNENFSNVPQHEILDSWPSRSRNSISSLWIVFDCKQDHSDLFEDLPDCFKTGIAPTTSSLRKIWRVWSSSGKEKQRDSHQFPSDDRIWQDLSIDQWNFVQEWFLFALTRSRSPKYTSGIKIQSIFNFCENHQDLETTLRDQKSFSFSLTNRPNPKLAI